MKELIPVAYDDLDFREHGVRVKADETVTIGLNGEWRELDLKEDNYFDFLDVFKRFWDAGQKVDAPKAKNLHSQARRKYFADLRVWCDERGRGKEYITPSGSTYYSVSLQQDYYNDTGIKCPDATAA